MCICVHNLKVLILHVYFSNINISLIMVFICLKTWKYLTVIYLDGSMSQNGDIRRVFWFMICRRMNSCENHKKSQKLSVFGHNKKSKA